MDNHKRRFVNSTEEDRISNLPENLIDSILEKLPIQDAIRTNILSKCWRYKWTTMTKLVLDKQFSEKFAKKGAFDSNGFIRITNQILNLHKGAILKLYLHIPAMILDSFQEVDQWILLLSRNGVRELILANSNQRYHLPSYMFLCTELRHLILVNCILKPPPGFQGFNFLKDLILTNIDFGDKLYETMITLPQLKNLTLDACINIYSFNIRSPRLQYLDVTELIESLSKDWFNPYDINSKRRYQLPSFVYFCLNLRKLLFQTPCIFNSPLDLQGFIYLEFLNLCNVEFGATFYGILNLPQLKFLKMVGCINIHNFNIQATKLQTLMVYTGPDATLLQLSHGQCLTKVIICDLESIRGLLRAKLHNLRTYLLNLRKTMQFSVTGKVIELFIAETFPRWLLDMVNISRHWNFIDIKLGDLNQLQGAMWILRNSPNLERMFVLKGRLPGMNLDEQPAISYLEASDCLNQPLNKLKNAEISFIEGSKPELLFIKLLMAHSPILEKMTIQLTGPADANFAKEVMRFRRASTKAELIFLDP